MVTYISVGTSKNIMVQGFFAVVAGGGSAIVADTVNQALEKQSIVIVSAITIASVVGGAAWWLSSELRGIKDSIDDVKKDMATLQCVRLKGQTCKMKEKEE